MANFAAINSTTINGAPAVAATPSVVDTQGKPYRLETRQQDGTLLHYLDERFSSLWVDEANVPGTLTFSYDGNHEFAGDFVFPNEVWLYQGDNTTVREKFVITNIEDVEDVGYFLRITCRSLLWIWSQEIITFAENTNTDIKTTLSDWIVNHQTQTPGINTFGMDSAIGNEVRNTRIENKSILEALNDLHKTIGGYFYVNNSRSLIWQRNPGVDKGHRIDIKKNATFIKKSTDYGNLATRIVAYGRGVDKDIRLSVTVDDATAQSTYGIITAVLNDQSIAHIDTPLVTYDVGMIDLSQTDVLDYTFEASALEIGAVINLLGNDSGVDITTRVLKITRNLDNPLDVKIEVGDPSAGTTTWGTMGDPVGQTVQGLDDIIVDIFKRVERGENDTGVIDDIEAQIAGGTLETPASPPLGDLSDIVWWDESADVGNLDEKVVDIVENNTDATAKADFEDAIAQALIDVVDNEGAAPHDSSVYDDFTEKVSGITWGGEVGALPTLPTERPEIVYFTTDDQLWIGYNGSGSSDEWTPMQKTTSEDGGTPT
jgi:hypothetical protein